MISILLLLVLAWGFYIGYRRGLVLQVYYFLVAVISAFVAGQFYKSLGDHFHLLVPYANPQEGQGTFFFPSDLGINYFTMAQRNHTGFLPDGVSGA